MYGEKVSDLSVIEKIFRSMTLRYGYVVCFIEESHFLDSMIVDELQCSLLVHEQRVNDHNSHEEQALRVPQDESSIGRGRGKKCFSRWSYTSKRGKEYNSKEFVEFYNEQGIQRQLTTSYTQQQNGIAERINQTIIMFTSADPVTYNQA
ncbi:hypothetical protein CR513_02547, partial [Mucuna pruriens]